MPTLYRDTGYSLSHLVEDIKTGRLALPDIQRPFVWSAAKARDLFDSMYRGYPVGTLMFWETGAEAGTRQIGAGDGHKAPQLLIVDGQQRLTSLYAVLTGQTILTKEFVKVRIRLAFRPTDETFEVTDAAIEKDPEFIPDITALWSEGYRTTVRGYLARLAASRGGSLSDEDEDRLEDRINRVHDLDAFRFQVVELGAGANEEQVADVFVRINSEGVPLNQADFILTLMSVHWEDGRRRLEAFSRAAVDRTVTGAGPRNAYIDPSPADMLRVGVALAFRRARLQLVYNVLRGKDLETGKFSAERREAQFARLAAAQQHALHLTNWHEYLKCLNAAGFRSRSMLSSEATVIYVYALWLIGRHDFGLDYAELRAVISRWFFMAHTTGRYTSSPETQVEYDLSRLAGLDSKAAFVAELDRTISQTFTSDYWKITLPNRLDTSSPRSPALFAYLAALNLLDADLLFSRLKVRDLLDPTRAAPRAIERHHLFPKKHLASIGITGTRQENSIANMAYLDWPENAEIGADAPVVYWPKVISRLDADRLKKQAYCHALPVGWEQLDYATFLERRRSLMAQVVHDGFDRLWSHHGAPPPVAVTDLIRAGESQTVEFKSTARYNVHTGQPDPKLEHVIVKSVCGFLNGEGGSLLIGVGDAGDVIGIEQDLGTLTKASVDGYELFLRQLLDVNLSTPSAATVRIDHHFVHNKIVFVVSVAASAKPVFAKALSGSGNPPSEFWVRVGNATKQLHGDDMVQYQTDHWG